MHKVVSPSCVEKMLETRCSCHVSEDHRTTSFPMFSSALTLPYASSLLHPPHPYKHTHTPARHLKVHPVLEMNTRVVETCGGNWPTRAPWVDVPGWWSQSQLLIIFFWWAQGLFVICLCIQCVLSYGFLQVYFRMIFLHSIGATLYPSACMHLYGKTLCWHHPSACLLGFISFPLWTGAHVEELA